VGSMFRIFFVNFTLLQVELFSWKIKEKELWEMNIEEKVAHCEKKNYHCVFDFGSGGKG
jgi:hypothetical protein